MTTECRMENVSKISWQYKARTKDADDLNCSEQQYHDWMQPLEKVQFFKKLWNSFELDAPLRGHVERGGFFVFYKCTIFHVVTLHVVGYISSHSFLIESFIEMFTELLFKLSHFVLIKLFHLLASDLKKN